jgi:hypothetical protein
MSAKIRKKELNNTRLANSYGGWIYCNECNNTIGYLCYVTYQNFQFDYTCGCGNKGSMSIELEEAEINVSPSTKQLITIKNRLCCPEDESPLVTIQPQKLKNFSFEIVCKECGNKYKGGIVV